MLRAPTTRRRWFRTLAAAGMPALPAAPAVAQAGAARVRIRLSHVVARQTPKGLTLERFRENVQ